MKKTIYAIIIIVVILGIIVLFDKKSASNPLPTENTGIESGSTLADDQLPTNVLRVTYTETGFSPAEISVTSGTTVEFLNMSGKEMWVASAPHPAHTDYPGFDSMKGVAQGETFFFEFNQAGTWKYHDHITPAMRGTIVVE